MKVSTIIIATVFALSSSLAFATTQANHRHHHHHQMHGTTTGMGSGASGPSTHAGGVDKSRVGGQGVSRKPAGE